MLSREEWLPLARKLDWDYSYVREDEVFPEVISGRPWLPHFRMGRMGRVVQDLLSRIRRQPI